MYLHLANPSAPAQSLPSQWQVVQDPKSLANLFKAKVPPTGIAITLELTWDHHGYTDWYGLELLSILRLRYAYTGPILMICGPQPEQVGYPSAWHWRDPGVGYVSQGDWEHWVLHSKQALPWPNPISKHMLEFLQILHYDRGTYIRGVLRHDLRHLQRELANGRPVGAEFRSLMRHLQHLLPGSIDRLEKLEETIRENLADAAPHALKPLEEFLAAYQEPHAQSDVLLEGAIQKWQVLIIDDAPLKELTNFLTQQGIAWVQAYSLAEALTHLEADRANRITVVICDFVFHDPQGRYAPIQGPEILHRLARRPHFLGFITLTDLPPAQIASLKSLYDIRHIPLYKKDVLDQQGSGFQTLYPILISENARIQEMLTGGGRLEKCPAWRLLYQLHRQSADYIQAEQYIADTAWAMLEKVRLSTEKYVKGFDDFNFQERLDRKLARERDLPIFRNRLLGRRIALGLLCLDGIALQPMSKKGTKAYKPELWDIISSIMRTGQIGPNFPDGTRDLLHRLNLSKNLVDPLKQAIFIEEIRWVQRYLDHLAKVSPALPT